MNIDYNVINYNIFRIWLLSSSNYANIYGSNNVIVFCVGDIVSGLITLKCRETTLSTI